MSDLHPATIELLACHHQFDVLEPMVADLLVEIAQSSTITRKETAQVYRLLTAIQNLCLCANTDRVEDLFTLTASIHHANQMLDRHWSAFLREK